MSLLIAVFGVFVLLLIAEILWRTKRLKSEGARKFVHITVGTFVAFWPYFMDWYQIQLMCLAFILVILVSWYLNIFQSVHSVKRRTWGELFFPLGIGISAFIEPPAIIFTAAILHLALADGFAAIIGLRYGMTKKYKYSIQRYAKSVVGTVTFFCLSVLIVLATVVFSSSGLSWPLLPLLIWLPLAATLVENVAVAGTDNIFVPLLVISVLQLAHIS